MSDVSSIIKSTSVALERQALTTFGAAINDAATGALRDVFKLPKPDKTRQESTGYNGVWTSTQYASALVKTNQVDFNPKLKFLFKVSFEFDPAIVANAHKFGVDLKRIQENISFTVTRIDRPKWDYTYEEVNMYNYRTKVLKEIKHREVGFTMYDDIGNSVLDFVNLYRKFTQPIARNHHSATNNKPEDFGMEFATVGPNHLDTSMRGALPDNAMNVFRKMTIHQIFVERGSTVTDPEAWVKAVNFEFIRPRFTSIDIDDMDHENGGNYSLVNFTMDFDTVFMTEKQKFSSDKSPSFPAGDIPVKGSNADSPMGGPKNPFIDIIANQAGRALQVATSNILHKTLGVTAGGGLIAGQLSGIGGTLAEATRRTLQGGTGLAIPSVPFLRDKNAQSSRSQSLSSQTISTPADQGEFL